MGSSSSKANSKSNTKTKGSSSESRSTEKKKLQIIFIGKPGCGKGTQAENLKTKFPSLEHLSTGTLLRDEVKAQTELGKKAEEAMQEGKLIEDDLMIQIIKNKLEKSPDVLLDGFPRTVNQAKALAGILEEKNLLVFLLDVDNEILRERILGRRIHQPSGRTYHIKFKPPKEEGKDDVTGEELTVRKDDSEEVLERRLKIYETSTEPCVEYYQERNLLKRIDASKDLESTWEQINSYL